MGAGDRPRGPRPARDAHEGVLALGRGIRRAAELAHRSAGARHAGHAAVVFNRVALELALRLGVATESKIRARSRFARKHYFYPDLPKGYQISQYDEPLCEDGHLELILGGELKRVRLQRIHLEEDAGKNMHVGAVSHVDLNRAGVPLVEVVSAPEMHSSEEAAEFMRTLHRLVRWLDISEADMEKGQMRCDANVSVRRRGEDRLGTRAELKNINSFKFVQNAVEHEIARQIRILEGGDRIIQETRLWDANAGTSQPMRSKETAEDYRYFPDPDLPPLVVDGATMSTILRGLPELPTARYSRYVRTHGLASDDARTIISDRVLAEYFEAAVKAHPGESGRMIANWMLTELLGTRSTLTRERPSRRVADATGANARRELIVRLASRTARSAARSARTIVRRDQSYKTDGVATRERRAPRRAADLR